MLLTATTALPALPSGRSLPRPLGRLTPHSTRTPKVSGFLRIRAAGRDDLRGGRASHRRRGVHHRRDLAPRAERLTGTAIVFGVLAHATLPGGHGLVAALLGLAAGLAAFFPFFALGGMGGGDVKLMAALGAGLAGRRCCGLRYMRRSPAA